MIGRMTVIAAMTKLGPRTCLPVACAALEAGAWPQQQAVLQGQGMRDAELLIWSGDFNYRIDASYELVKELASKGLSQPECYAKLLELVRTMPQSCAGHRHALHLIMPRISHPELALSSHLGLC